jgi:N utilization substance protein B
MSRRTARELVLQSLYQVDFSKADPETALQASMEERNVEEDALTANYARTVLMGTVANMDAIDEKIGQYAKNWELSRMPIIDRNILRMAVYEMLFAEEKQPVNIAVNEAVEIAKLYGTEKSSGFINGVLGQMMRNGK